MSITTEAVSPAAPFLGRPGRMLIEGEWVEARDGRTLAGTAARRALDDAAASSRAGDARWAPG
jgi:hypothetical protein